MKRITHPISLSIPLSLALASAGMAQSFDLSWHTIDGGGGTSSGGSFTLSGTIGQPAVNELDGGGYSLSGGFWPANVPALHHGDMNCDGAVNNFDIDAFVLALTSESGYAAAYPNCNINNGDINNDGAVNNFDIDPFVSCLISGCP